MSTNNHRVRIVFIALTIVLITAATSCDGISAPSTHTEAPLNFEASLARGPVTEDTDTLIIQWRSRIPPRGVEVLISKANNTQIFRSLSGRDQPSTDLISRIVIARAILLDTDSVRITLKSLSAPENASSRILVTKSGIITNWPATPVRIPTLPSANIDLFPNLNWNDVVGGSSDSYDFNGDGVPDVISFDAALVPNPPVFRIGDFLGRTIFQFDIKQANPAVRDSLHWVGFASADLDNDGDLDMVLHYNGEFPSGDPTMGFPIRFIGSNIYALFNKGNLQYDVVEIYDNPSQIFFQQLLHDWDGDGLIDLMVRPPEYGEYFKNMGGNRFEYRTMPPPPIRMDGASIAGIDYDGDGQSDKINLFGGNYYNDDCSVIYQTQVQYLYVLSRNTVNRFPVTGTTLRKNLYRCPGTAGYERINMVDGDGDGDLDLVVSFDVYSPPSDVARQRSDYFENVGSSFDFRPGYIEVPTRNLYSQFLQVWVRDIDGDGRKDLYYGTYSKSRMYGIDWQPFWWRNTGQGFRISTSYRLSY